MDNSEPRSICTFCLISAFLRLIRLSFSPTSPSALRYYLSSYHVTYLVGRSGFGNYLVLSVVLTGWLPSLPLRRHVGLFRCRFDQCNVQACALAACTVSVISTNAFAYLPGLHAARPSAFVEGERFELPKRFAACLVSSEVLSSTQPTFQICLS